jgi:hypothetical protein
MKAAETVAAMMAVREQATEQKIFYFHDQFRNPWATVPVGAHRETWLVRSQEMWLWIARALRDRGIPPTQRLVKGIVEDFEMTALVDGPMLPVFVRIGEGDGVVYLDLGNPAWESVAIAKDGWQVVAEPGVKFRRPLGLAALPTPIKGGNCKEILRFLNVRSQHEILFLAWLTFCFRPRGPYPILAMSGPQGSGKSTSTRALQSLMDPNIAALRGAPHDSRSLVMSASNSRLLCFDNMSEIKAEMSDMFCRIAVGGSHAERKYYTNDGSEQMFTFQNPVVVNGIAELPERPDLLDRGLVVNLLTIAEKDRRSEEEFYADFERARPRLLGAVLDAVVVGMATVETVQLPGTPRMADFARWGVAVEKKLGYPPGSFLEAYRQNLGDATAAALENSPIAWPIHHFIESLPGKEFRGTGQQLLRDLTAYVTLTGGHEAGQPLVLRHPRWPKSASALSGEIARIEPNLAKLGLSVARGRTKVRRFIELRAAAAGGAASRTGAGNTGVGQSEKIVTSKHNRKKE